MTAPMGASSELLAPRVEPGAKERPLRELGLGDVRGNRLGRGEVQPDAAVLVAFLVERDGRLVAVLVEVLDPEATRGANSGPAIEEELDDGPVAVVEHRVAGWEPHELPGTGRREGLGLVARVRRAPGDELGVAGLGTVIGSRNSDGDTLEVLVEGGQATRSGG